MGQHSRDLGQCSRDLVLWVWHRSTELFPCLYYSSSSSGSSFISPKTDCSMDWIPQRVLAHKYFPAELPGGLRGAQQPHTWDNTQLHHHIHDFPASPPHGDPHHSPIPTRETETAPSLVHNWAQPGGVWKWGQAVEDRDWWWHSHARPPSHISPPLGPVACSEQLP